ncbi:MAG TPA: hypothetical protein VF477_01145, partial [Mycobacterium sp.]
DRVSRRNRVLRDQWREETKQQDDEREDQIDGLRDAAASTAAALHTASNWLIIGLLIYWLAVTF